MIRLGQSSRLVAVAAGYAAAFVAFQRFMPFSVTSPWFVLIAMVCFLGLAFVAQPVVMLSMPGPLRGIRRWEAEGRWYRALRVPEYGRLLRRTPLRLFNRDVYLSDGRQDTGRVLEELEAAEASHFWGAMLVLPYMAYLAGQGAWAALLGFSLAQMFINVYPIMHLRLARHRLDRLAARRPRPLGGRG